MLNPESGAHTVYELTDDRIKAVMITNPYGPEPWSALWDGQFAGVSEETKYGIAHAVIGFYYTGGTEGFTDGGAGSEYDTIFRQLPGNITEWVSRNKSTLNKYKAYVAKSSGQDIVWLEKNPTGKVTLKKSSANPKQI